MNNVQSIQVLSDDKIKEAESLFSNGFYDAAYYHSGYAVELLLKARICVNLQIDNFYDFGNRDKFMNEDNITKPFKVHNFEQLLLLSGLIKEHAKQMNDVSFDLDWNRLVKWKEDVRYIRGNSPTKVVDFITSVKNFATWIKKHL